MDPNKIFLFNSCLPEQHCSAGEWLRRLGPSTRGTTAVNIGNGYISYALLKTLFGSAARLAHLPNAWEDDLPSSLADHINGSYSHFIFVMQDYIRADLDVLPFERINRFLEKIRIPLVPISLGANSLSGYDSTLGARLSVQQKRFLWLVSEKAALVGVRGQYTAETLNQLGIKKRPNHWLPVLLREWTHAMHRETPLESGPHRHHRLLLQPHNPKHGPRASG